MIYLIIGIVMGITVISEIVVMLCDRKHKKAPSLFNFVVKNSVFSIMKGRDSNKRKSIEKVVIWENGDESKIIEDFDSVNELQNILSCQTCKYFNGNTSKWCESQNKPNIEKNYCSTFVAN